MSSISYDEAKALVLARLRQWLSELPESEKRRPRKIVNFQPYSVLDLIAEVERDSDVGKTYVFDEAKLLGYVVE
jgi:hypothetical protein